MFALLRLLLMSNQDKDAEILALRHQITVLERQLGRDRVRFASSDRVFLAALLHRLPRGVLLLGRPDTVLRRHRDLVSRRHTARSRPKRSGRPRTVRSIRVLILRLARENPGWGYRRIHGELLVVGVQVAASTVWEILKEAGIAPAPERGSQPAHPRRPRLRLGDGWCFVHFSVPESARAMRHQLTSHLTSLGFGNIGSAVWIAPARMLPAAQRAIDELGLTDQCAVFVGDYVAGQELTSLVRNGWDLDEIDLRYREFIDEYSEEGDSLAAAAIIDGKRAFDTYLSVIDHWRKLPFRDPGLPPEVLTEDWSGPAAVRLFERLVAVLEGRALAYAALHWSGPSRAAQGTINTR
ncbi:PaaX family transcriptional regulator C-terminal domain-containing protein [Streptomyces ureilyticus]|uniref:PaaX family transcriptional regulator C-terminal domain-containing protein n=1 Tax=Streptomyces ureilyticus TaxID=1775131 RepID=UPI0038B555EA